MLMDKKLNVVPLLACPACRSGFDLDADSHQLICPACGQAVQVVSGKPYFTPVPDSIPEMQPFERGPGMGTPWRQANWRFLEREIQRLPADALVLDVGAGRGDFAQLVRQRPSLSLDVYPYPEVEVICDLTQVNPFREELFDAVVLMNVLEHVFDTGKFLSELHQILKPGGRLIAAVPFLIKEHLAPFDFFRYTQFSLRKWGEACGFSVEKLEGYYDPMFLVDQGTNNLKHSVFPHLGRMRNYLARAAMVGLQISAAGISMLVGKGAADDPEKHPSPAPIGYQVVYRKAD